MANPMNFSDPFNTYGPGLASLWGGEQVGLSFDQQRADQAKTLEEIATAQQTREHNAQMQPFKVDEARLKNEKTKTEMTAAKYADFVAALEQDVLTQGNMAGPPDSVGNAARWQAQAQAMGLDPEDYRVKVALGTAAQGPEGLKKLKEATYRLSPKGQEKTDDFNRQKAADAAAGERNTADNTSRERQAHITGGYSVQRAQIQAKARAAAQEKKQSLLQITKGDPVKTIAALVTEANMLARQGNADAANALYEAANDPVLQAAAQNQQANAGKLTVGPNGQLTTTGASVPLPRAGPPAGAPGTQAANPATTAPGTVPPAPAGFPPKGTRAKTKDGRDVESDGQGWILVGPK